MTIEDIARKHVARSVQAEWRPILLAWLEVIMATQLTDHVERLADALAARLAIEGVEPPHRG